MDVSPSPDEIKLLPLIDARADLDYRVVALSQAIAFMERVAPAGAAARPPVARNLNPGIPPHPATTVEQRHDTHDDTHLRSELDRTLVVASRFLHWLQLGGTPNAVILTAQVFDSNFDNPVNIPKGILMAQITDSQKLQLTATPEDAAGFPTNSAVTYSIDNSAVAELLPVDDGTGTGTDVPDAVWVSSLEPGSVVVTASVDTGEVDASGNAVVLTATFAVDVVPGNVAQVQIVAGDPVAK